MPATSINSKNSPSPPARSLAQPDSSRRIRSRPFWARAPLVDLALAPSRLSLFAFVLTRTPTEVQAEAMAQDTVSAVEKGHALPDGEQHVAEQRVALPPHRRLWSFALEEIQADQTLMQFAGYCLLTGEHHLLVLQKPQLNRNLMSLRRPHVCARFLSAPNLCQAERSAAQTQMF